MNWDSSIYWLWPKTISNNCIEKIDHIIQNNYHKLENPSSQGAGKVTTTKVISYEKLFEIEEIKHQYYIAEYIAQHTFGYNIFPPSPIKSAIYNEYYSAAGGKYDWHVDNSSSPKFDTKMTFIINLSKEYTGGEFELYNKQQPDTITEFSQPGTMILFKSYTMHRVTPVLSGVRRTLTFFFNGPSFQ
jgi:predicted 2-oxoglutarate/Fe(II)-dependent dioxygenase YbiX